MNINDLSKLENIGEYASKLEKLIEENRIHFVPSQQNMYVKIYKHEHKGVPLSNLWNDIHSITRTSKEIDLISNKFKGENNLTKSI